MGIEDYLSGGRSQLPARGTVGIESDWLPFCTIEVPRGLMWAGDPQGVWAEVGNDDGLIRVPAGTYRVDVKGMDFAGRRFVSRMRVCLKEIRDPVLGRQCGEAGTDTAQIGVGDARALKDAFDAVCGDDYYRAMELIEQQTSSAFGVCRPERGSDAAMAFVPSGIGDGCGPVFELLSSGTRVGIELEFLPNGCEF